MRGPRKKPKQPAAGLFITFEGGEGSGKSTQAKLLSETLQAEGYQVVATHEPGGSPGGRVIREVLLGGHASDKGPLAEACLLTSARREHVETLIQPALDEKKVVICDRYADSTRVYQGLVGGVPEETIDRLELVATNQLMPNVTFVLDVSEKAAQQRRQARQETKRDEDDRFEKEDQKFHERVLAGFRQLAKSNPKRCILVDGEKKADRVAVSIRDALRLRGLA